MNSYYKGYEWDNVQYLKIYAYYYYTVKLSESNDIGFCKWIVSNKIQSIKKRMAVKEIARAKRLAEGSNKFHRLNGEIKEMEKTIIKFEKIISIIDEIIKEAKQK